MSEGTNIFITNMFSSAQLKKKQETLWHEIVYSMHFIEQHKAEASVKWL